MNKRISLGAAIAFALVVAAAVFSITMDYAETRANKSLSALHERETFYNKFSEIDRETRDVYYGEINEQNLKDATSKGYISGIGDPGAKYYTAEEYSKLLQDEDTDTGSVGIKARPGVDGYLEITEVVLDSPASISKIEVGALIVEIDEEAITVDNNQENITKLEGPDGSKISLVVRTGGEDQFHDLTRRLIVAPTVTWSVYEQEKIGYIRITSFDQNSFNLFNRALTEIQQKGGERIIFDLRGNASVDFSSATRILDRIIPRGILVKVVDKDKKEIEAKRIMSESSAQLDWPIGVIVNSGTSGAAEMFAQILADYGKAKTIGTVTAGKGVQVERIRLSDGSAIELTVALYQSPVTNTIFDGEGLHPDYDVPIPGLMAESDWEKLSEDMDRQLLRALEVVTSS